MRFRRIRLSQFKCYDDADLRLDRGVTVIHGVNGSGKSSLLEACFFALYGARALDKTLDEVVTNGAEEAEVELWFTHGGDDYHIERRLRVRDGSASTAKCVLDAPDLTIEGARDVRGHVADLLRMDSEAFVNCAYVRQGEVNKLINASPGERQDMIDDLLQLGKLEAYRQRASDARVGVGRVRDDKQGALAQLDDQIAAKEDANLHERLNDLQSDLAEVDDQIDHYESQRDNAETTREEAQSILEEYEQTQAELDELETDIEDLRDSIQDTESQREDVKATIREHRERIEATEETVTDLLAASELSPSADQAAIKAQIETLEERDDDLRDRIEQERLDAQQASTEADSLREQASDLEARAEQKREEADELATELEDEREQLAERREQLETLGEQIESARATFADAPVEPGQATAHRESIREDLDEIRDAIADRTATIQQVSASIEEAERLLEEGKCPECGQPVDESPHVESLADQRDRLESLEANLADLEAERDAFESQLEAAEQLVEAQSQLEQLRDRRETIGQLIDERESGLEESQSRIGTLREEAERLQETAEDRREQVAQAEATAESHRETVAEYNQQRGDLRERIDRLESIESKLDTISEAEAEIERLQDRRQHLAEVNDERRERLAEKRERRTELEETVDESALETARQEKQRASEYIEQVTEEIQSLQARKSNLQSQIGGVRNEIEELESLRERRQEVATVLERLESLYEEAHQLQELYGTLRAELRQRNVETLERMLNETFDLVYQNDSYARIELDGEYELTIYQKDGETLDPDQLSGGERALFNLSLRCAIYRLLAEGIDGAAPMPPLILDEPTVFLDSGHVSQLVELIDRMHDLGVEQIVVVSHDDELVGAADDLVHVAKDPTTNRSSVKRRAPRELLSLPE